MWGGVSIRALPLDFRLKTLFQNLGQDEELASQGYNLSDWPINYEDLRPYYELAEAFLGISGDGKALEDTLTTSAWLRDLGENGYGKINYPNSPMALPPAGFFLGEGLIEEGHSYTVTPYSIVPIGKGNFSTIEALNRAVNSSAKIDQFWQDVLPKLTRDFQRASCNSCGFCGGFPCWGKDMPRANMAEIFLKRFISKEVRQRINLVSHAKAFEVIYDEKSMLS